MANNLTSSPHYSWQKCDEQEAWIGDGHIPLALPQVNAQKTFGLLWHHESEKRILTSHNKYRIYKKKFHGIS